MAVNGQILITDVMHAYMTPSVTAAPCQTFGVPLACLPHSGRQAPRPRRGSSFIRLFSVYAISYAAPAFYAEFAFCSLVEIWEIENID